MKSEHVEKLVETAKDILILDTLEIMRELDIERQSRSFSHREECLYQLAIVLHAARRVSWDLRDATRKEAQKKLQDEMNAQFQERLKQVAAS